MIGEFCNQLHCTVRVSVPALVAEVVEVNVPLSFLLTSPQLKRNTVENNSASLMHFLNMPLRGVFFTFFRRHANGRRRVGRKMAAAEAGTVSLAATVIRYVPAGVVDEVVTVSVPDVCVLGLSL